jgi:hypothetical protein
VTLTNDTPTRAQCVERVYRPHQFMSGQCAHKAVVERDGKPYCRQHDPVAKQEREERQRLLSEIERAGRARVMQLEKALASRDRAFVDACETFMVDGSATPERVEALARVLCARIIKASAEYDRAVKA